MDLSELGFAELPKPEDKKISASDAQAKIALEINSGKITRAEGVALQRKIREQVTAQN